MRLARLCHVRFASAQEVGRSSGQPLIKAVAVGLNQDGALARGSSAPLHPPPWVRPALTRKDRALIVVEVEPGVL